MDLSAHDRRQLLAGIAATGYEASLAQLRAILLDQDARAQYRDGLADAREDFYVRVLEGELAIAGEIQELTAGLGNALSLITKEAYARATVVEAEAVSRTDMRVEMDELSAAAREELRVWVDDSSGVAWRTTGLEVALDGDGQTPGITARLGTVETAIADPVTGIVARIDGLDVIIDGDEQTPGISARLGTAEAAIGDAAQGTGLAGQVDVIETTVNDPETGVAATATALDTLITSIGPEGETLAVDIQTLSVSDSTNNGMAKHWDD